MNMEQQLLESAKRYCEQQGIKESTIQVESAGTNIYCYFGNVEEYGFQAVVDVFTIDNSLSSIIVSAGKNQAGKSIWVETRDQEILEAFLYYTGVFSNWMDDAMNRLEKKFG